MSIYIDSDIKSLSEKLMSSRQDDSLTHINNEVILRNTQWATSILLSEILFAAKKEPKFSDDDLFHFHKKYEQDNSIKISLDKIQNDQWIRHINEEIRLPNAITKALWAFRKEEDGESVEFPKFIAENIAEFRFLHSLHKVVGYSDSRKILIEKQNLEEIINKHRLYFPQTPAFEELLSDLDINVKDNKYKLGIGNGYNSDWSYFSDEISARLWERMLTEYSHKSINEIFDEWIDKSIWTKNPCKNMTDESRKKLLEAVWHKLTTEPDIEYSQYESAKIFLDDYLSHQNWENGMIIPERYKINNESFFYCYNSFRELDKDSHGIASHQEIRTELSFLIRLIVDNDNAYQGFPQIKKLLTISLEKPFIFYDLLQILQRQYVHILPYLLTEKGLFLVIFDCLSDTKIANVLLDDQKDFQEQSRQKQITKILLKCTNIYLQSALQHRENDDEIASNINEILHSTLKKLFSRINTNNYNSSLLEKEEYKSRFQDILYCILSFKSPVANNFIKRIYPFLFAKIKEITRPLQTHAVLHGIYFPKYYLIGELIKRENSSSDNKKELLELFVDSFKEEIELDTIDVQDYWHNIRQQQEVSWSDNQYGYELIDWSEIMLLAGKYSLLDELLNSFKAYFRPKQALNDERERDKVHDWNRSQTYKLRLILRILLSAYHNIIEKKAYYENLWYDTKETKTILERKIIQITTNNNKSDFENGRYSIFSNMFESIPSGNVNLFSQLGEASNFFSQNNRRMLIDSFLENDDVFEKYIELYNLLFLEGDRQYLKEKLEQIPVKEYIDRANWLPQLENTLIHAINSNLFTQQAEEILDYYEKIAEKRFKNNEKKVDFIFRIKLLLAYRHDDKQELLKIKVPEKMYHVSSYNKEAENQKLFYQSLFDLKEEKYAEALQKLEQLCASEPDNTEFFIRKCYVRTLIADNLKIKDTLEARVKYQIILDEINKYDFSSKSYYNKELIDYVKLSCFSYLDTDDSNYYNLFSQLHLSQKIDEGYLRLTVKSLIGWGEYSKASTLIDDARKFHVLRNGSFPNFLNELSQDLGTDDNLKRLKLSFQEIICLSFENLTKIIPERINRSTNDYREFIAYEIALASENILEKIKTVHKLNDENSYSDFLEILLNSRIKLLGRDGFSSQNRSGYSATGKSPGSLDLRMILENKNLLIEAIRWHNSNFKADLQEHITKTFNYDPSRVAFYNVMYYEHNDFHNDWIKFKDDIFTNLNFPTQYPICGDIEDISDKLGNNSVRVALSLHANDLSFYHILVNINYKTK